MMCGRDQPQKAALRLAKRMVQNSKQAGEKAEGGSALFIKRSGGMEPIV